MDRLSKDFEQRLEKSKNFEQRKKQRLKVSIFAELRLKMVGRKQALGQDQDRQQSE